MSSSVPASAPAQADDLLQNLDHPSDDHGHTRRLGGWAAWLVVVSALSFSVFQLVVAAFSPLSSLPTRSIHVGFLMLLAFLLYPARSKSARDRLPWIDLLLALGCFVLGLYHWKFEADLVMRSGDPSTADMVVGVACVVLLFEASRRVLGLALPIVCEIGRAHV